MASYLYHPASPTRLQLRIFENTPGVIVVNAILIHLGITSFVTNNREIGRQAADILAGANPAA